MLFIGDLRILIIGQSVVMPSCVCHCVIVGYAQVGGCRQCFDKIFRVFCSCEIEVFCFCGSQRCVIVDELFTSVGQNVVSRASHVDFVFTCLRQFDRADSVDQFVYVVRDLLIGA